MAKSTEERYSAFFDQADEMGDNNGELSMLELWKIVKSCGFEKTAEDVAYWFDAVDLDDDKKVTKSEFMEAMTRIDPEDVKEADLRCAFKDLDKDCSGCITVEDLKQILAEKGLDPEDAHLGDMDMNDDGKVSYEEFLRSIRGGNCQQ